jgi:hypothetical protein
MGLVANRMRFYGTRGFQLGLLGTESDRMRFHAHRMRFYWTRGFQLRLVGTEAY